MKMVSESRYSELAPAAREWQVGKLAGRWDGVKFGPPRVGNTGGRLIQSPRVLSSYQVLPLAAASKAQIDSEALPHPIMKNGRVRSEACRGCREGPGTFSAVSSL